MCKYLSVKTSLHLVSVIGIIETRWICGSYNVNSTRCRRGLRLFSLALFLRSRVASVGSDDFQPFSHCNAVRILYFCVACHRSIFMQGYAFRTDELIT